MIRLRGGPAVLSVIYRLTVQRNPRFWRETVQQGRRQRVRCYRFADKPLLIFFFPAETPTQKTLGQGVQAVVTYFAVDSLRRPRSLPTPVNRLPTYSALSPTQLTCLVARSAVRPSSGESWSLSQCRVWTLARPDRLPMVDAQMWSR